MTDSRRRQLSAVTGSILFFFLAPGIVAGVIPWAITHWDLRPPLLGFTIIRLAGLFFVVSGLIFLLETFGRFALQGLGTPSPTHPAEHLVIAGSYRFVRNPMYLAVMSTLIGQALIFGAPLLLVYCAIAWLATHGFIVKYEEPTLRRKYGDEYDKYRANVPRWIPRQDPWHMDEGEIVERKGKLKKGKA